MNAAVATAPFWIDVARPEDVAAAAEIGTSIVRELGLDTTSGRIAGQLRSYQPPDGLFLVAVETASNAIIGGLVAKIREGGKIPGREAFVDAVCVLPSHRRQGVGRELIDIAERWASNAAAQHIYLGIPANSRLQPSSGYILTERWYRKAVA